MSYVQKLQLTAFRCYETAVLEDLSSGPVILYGANGAGKTNILEAVSMLSPGRGLRGAKIGEMQRQIIGTENNNRILSETPPWSLSAVVQSDYGEIKIGTGRDMTKEKRIVRINGETARGQNALAEYLACVWLTPQMDRLFIEGASGRRRFLDRLVFAFDPGHSGRLIRYENAMRQRSKLLQETDGRADPSWLSGLESTMAETGVSIAAARLHFIECLQQACDKAEDGLFPKAKLAMTGTIDELLSHSPAVEVEGLFKYQLKKTRQQDAVTGGAATGPHKSDFFVQYAAKNMPADQCSTGEQKALLVGIVLAHSRLIAAERGTSPILLLDEVAAHLDQSRREGLYGLLLEMKGQVWITGTDKGVFDTIRAQSSCFEVADHKVFYTPDLAAA